MATIPAAGDQPGHWDRLVSTQCSPTPSMTVSASSSGWASMESRARCSSIADTFCTSRAAHVVQVLPGSDTYEMAEVLGRQWSAWNGAVNVLSIRSRAGDVRSRLFLSDEIQVWGENPQRISQVLAWVTVKTNVPRLREHVRPEGVRLLSTRRRVKKIQATAAQMKIAELRMTLSEAVQQVDDQERVFDEFTEENEDLLNELSRFKDELRDSQDELRRKNFELNSLKGQLSAVGTDKSVDFDPEPFKIGIADDPTQTIRVHFHWDGTRRRIVIGHCGEHLPVPSH